MENMMKAIPPHLIPVMKEVMMSEDPKNMLKVEMKGDQPVVRMSLNAKKNVEFVNKEWEMRDGDVLIASYPKTGTNWMTEVIDRIIYQENEVFQRVKAIPLPTRAFEMTIPKKFQIWDALPLDRRVFVTHLSADKLDLERIKKKNVKIVYVLRNPKDTLVSMYNFLKKLPPFQKEPLKALVHNGWEVFYKNYMNKAFPLDGSDEGVYLEHILGWLKVKKEMGIQFVFFENMKKNFCAGVRELAEFLETSVSDDKLEEIAGQCTIESMRKNFKARAGIQATHATAFINKGGVGGWKNYFTVAQSEEWDKLVEEKLSDTEIKFQYTI